MDLILFLQATQNRNGVFDCWLAHQHRLETTLKRSILFDVLAVFVERSSTDSMKLATSQSRLQHIARVHGAIARGAGAHNGVQLIDEQDNLPVGLLHFAKDSLQTVFELTTILSASEHRRKVKRNKLTVFQAGGNVTRNDALGQAFNDCRFAHARLANKHRVVLRTTGKNLNGTTNFLGTTDYRIEFAITCLLSKVLAILLQHLELSFRLRIGYASVAAEILISRLDCFTCNTSIVQDAARLPFVFRKGNEQMLGGDVVVVQLSGDFLGVVHQGIEFP